MSCFHIDERMGRAAAVALVLAGGLLGMAQAQVVNLSAPAEGAAAPGTQARPAAPATAAPTDLLALQRSGAAASPTAYPVPAAVAQKTYRRYVDSFAHPIPEWQRSSVGTSRSASGASR